MAGPARAGSSGGRSVTAAIASSRGGRGFLVASGPERGASFSRSQPLDFTERSASLRSFLKITRADQIGFKTSSEPGETSIVTSIPLNNPFLVRRQFNSKVADIPEVKSNIVQLEPLRDAKIPQEIAIPLREKIVFIGSRVVEPKVREIGREARSYLRPILVEPLRVVAGSEIRSQSLRQNEQIDDSFIQRIMASRVRGSLALVRAIKTQTLVAPEIKTQAAPALQRVVNLTQPTEVATGVTSLVDSPSERVNPQVARIAQERGSALVQETDQDINRRYIGPDDELNKERRRVLKAAYVKLREENPASGVDGKRLVASSDIFARYLRSKLLSQVGFDEQEDGGQNGAAKNIEGLSDVGERDIEDAVEANTALVRSRRMPRRLAAQEELKKVFTPKEGVIAFVPVKIIQEEIREILGPKKIVEIGGRPRVPSVAIREPQAESESAEEPILPISLINYLNPVQSILDRQVHNIEAFNRKGLVA